MLCAVFKELQWLDLKTRMPTPSEMIKIYFARDDLEMRASNNKLRHKTKALFLNCWIVIYCSGIDPSALRKFPMSLFCEVQLIDWCFYEKFKHLLNLLEYLINLWNRVKMRASSNACNWPIALLFFLIFFFEIFVSIEMCTSRIAAMNHFYGYVF